MHQKQQQHKNGLYNNKYWYFKTLFIFQSKKKRNNLTLKKCVDIFTLLLFEKIIFLVFYFYDNTIKQVLLFLELQSVFFIFIQKCLPKPLFNLNLNYTCLLSFQLKSNINASFFFSFLFKYYILVNVSKNLFIWLNK